ncbi:GPCR fungal pheromone mating factor [Amylostereum chailletii]|nr:GPCR fungal pheromone mating factor [Amylostereum chailletii]
MPDYTHLPHYPLVPVANVIASVLILLSVINSSSRHAWNAGVVMLGVWIFALGLITAVDAIVWSNNVDIVSPVWCDISTRIGLGSAVGVPACALVITRRLCKIAKGKGFEMETPLQRRLDFLLEIMIGFGLPALIVILYYIVQGARFLIFEEIGCNAAVYACGLAILLMHTWGIIYHPAAYFPAPIIWTFLRHNQRLNGILRDSASGISRSRYYRLLALGCIDIILTLPMGILHIVLDIGQLEPRVFWPGWDVVHEQFDEIVTATADEWRPDFWSRFGLGFDNWVNPAFAVAFFVLFGLTSEARRTYATVFWGAVGLVGWKRPERPELSRIGFGSVPVDTRGTDVGSRCAYFLLWTDVVD